MVLQATRQHMEFMRNFYKIFPEYQEIDVSCSQWVLIRDG